MICATKGLPLAPQVTFYYGIRVQCRDPPAFVLHPAYRRLEKQRSKLTTVTTLPNDLVSGGSLNRKSPTLETAPHSYLRSDVQCAQRVALIGIADKQCGQSLVVGAAAGAGLCSLLACLTIRKIAKAMMRKLVT